MFDITHSIMRISIMAVPFLLAVTCHEVAHGLVAYWYGDPTAKFAGRLTLNPVKHLDPMGTLVFIITALTGGFIIGWAKPVPVNYSRFRAGKVRQGIIMVSAAGAAANVLLATLFYFAHMALRGAVPAEGGLLATAYEPLYLITQFGVVINVILAVFNLIPIPPLDGSKILAELLPAHLAHKYLQIERYGFFILIALIMFGGLRFIFEPIWFLLDRILY